LWQLSTGSNDIRHWRFFAKRVSDYGLGSTYVTVPLFNHPPMMGLVASLTWKVSWALGLPFPQTFKVWPLAAELGIAYLLFSIWSRRGEPDRAAFACAAYGCALVCILISGFHGNVDPVLWFLLLASCYFLESHRAPFRAGLCLGAALEIKLIPVLVVLPLAATCRDLREFRRFCAGAIVALIPFGLPLLWLSPVERVAFFYKIFGYKSFREDWGIEMIARQVYSVFHASAPKLAMAATDFAAYYRGTGAKYLLVATTLLAVWQAVRQRNKLDAYTIVALCLCLFLVFASGFGVQYLGCVVPVLMAFDIAAGFVVATATGIFAASIYCYYVVNWNPITTVHNGIGQDLAPVAFLAWWVVAGCALKIWRGRAVLR
jgi:hypothetical protein